MSNVIENKDLKNNVLAESAKKAVDNENFQERNVIDDVQFGDFDQDEDILIDVRNVSMRFKMPSEKVDDAKEAFIKLIKGKLKYRDFWVLNDISLQVRRGESFAIVGRNGAGKSTLLSLISGIYNPTKGHVRTRGSIVPLLRLGAGFDPNSTGKENVFLNGAILGFSKKEMQDRYDEIVEFSELKDFMNVQVKNYSSGMIARLGFAIAVSVKPDIMIVDEILSVGDAPFQKKCTERMEELRKSGTTFLVVSHNMQRVKMLCKTAIWIKNGSIIMRGTSKEVADAYTKDCR